MSMPSGKQPPPGPFARAISEEIRSSMARQRMNRTQLASKASLSPSYLSKRLRDEVAFTANDIEDICEALGEDLMTLIHAAVRSTTGARNVRMTRP